MAVAGGLAIGAALVAGSTASLGFGLDSGIEAIASIIVIWRFTGTRLASATSERRTQKLVAVSFYLLAPHLGVKAIRALAAGDCAETSIPGLVLMAGTAIFEGCSSSIHPDVWLTDRLNRVSHLGADDALCPIDEPTHTSEVDISCVAELKKSNDVHGTNDARRRRR